MRAMGNGSQSMLTHDCELAVAFRLDHLCGTGVLVLQRQ